MPRRNLESPRYILGFATAVCFVCSLFVAGAAVGLRERQEKNEAIDKKSKVLSVAGLFQDDEVLSPSAIETRYAERIEAIAIDMKTGTPVRDWSSETIKAYDQREAAKDPERSTPMQGDANANQAKVRAVPNVGLVYLVVDPANRSHVEQLIVPVSGYGLWSTLYGFLALKSDAQTVSGITFYEHAETPGLGGEVDNPKWKALWPGRKLFDTDGHVALRVIKGKAGPPTSSPHQVDGLSGATITSNGVSNLLAFWLDKNGYGPFLKKVAREGLEHVLHTEPDVSAAQGGTP